MRIATWNVNSVRLRLDGLKRLIDGWQPDVICLQETKIEDDRFPLAVLAEWGFGHMALFGIKAYHGVAIVSRLPLDRIEKREWCGKCDGRHVSAVVDGRVEVHNLYVPAGGDVPDPDVNVKFRHKLDFLDEMTAWWRSRRDLSARGVLVGDLNVAPLEHDVWSHRQLLNVVSHTPVEVERLGRLQASNDWIDSARRFVPEDQKLYTWWSYRARDWAASDRGRRLDHIWVTPGLGDALRSVETLREARGWASPSDHVPVLAEIDA